MKCKIFFHYCHCLYREKFQSLYHFQLGNCVQADWNGTHLGQLAIQAAAAACLSVQTPGKMLCGPFSARSLSSISCELLSNFVIRQRQQPYKIAGYNRGIVDKL